MNLSILDEYGIDSKLGLSRCVDSEDFFRELLLMFLEDEAFGRAQKAFQGRDYAELFDAAHELKGVASNIALQSLFVASSQVVELVRKEPYDAEKIEKAYDLMEKEYARTIEGIKIATK